MPLPNPVSDTELEAYLDEVLPVELMSLIEERLRSDTELSGRLARIVGRRDAGVHSLGAIWRRARVSCPSREDLGSYLLRALSDDVMQNMTFHLETVACRYCLANLEDLKLQAAPAIAEVESRRRRYFHSSAGLLKGK